jgi:hypothetical protein
MIRVFAEGLFLFTLPFLLFAVWLVAKGFNPLEPGAWSRSALSWLTIGALGLVIASVIWIGATRENAQGTFVPSHVEDGRFVPGYFRPATPP